MILEFYTYVISCFGTKVLTKNKALFQDISSFKSEQDDNINLSRTWFLYTQKK